MTKSSRLHLNAELIEASKASTDVLLMVQDTSFISKSGKLTSGLGFFWNGSESKVQKGLEIDVIGVVRIGSERKEAYTISAEQSAGDLRPKAERKKKEATESTKIDAVLDHLKRVTPL